MDKGRKWKDKQMPHGTEVKGLHKWRKKEVEAITQLTHHTASPVYIGPSECPYLPLHLLLATGISGLLISFLTRLETEKMTFMCVEKGWVGISYSVFSI